MPMAGCHHCGRVETIPGHPEARVGEAWKPCPECGHDLQWVRVAQAADLVRESHDAGVRRAPPLDPLLGRT